MTYDEIAEFALPYLKDRPVSLVRAPEGIHGELFFQKHEERSKIPGITRLPVEMHPGHPPLLVVDHHAALIGRRSSLADELGETPCHRDRRTP